MTYPQGREATYGRIRYALGSPILAVVVAVLVEGVCLVAGEARPDESMLLLVTVAYTAIVRGWRFGLISLGIVSAYKLHFDLVHAAQFSPLRILVFLVVGGVILWVLLDLQAHRTRASVEAAELKERAYQAAMHASHTKDEFLAVMSHELRTPLTAVMGFSELLLDGIGGPVSEDQTEMLTRIDESSKHLLGLIEQVLDFTRAERGQLLVSTDPVDVRDVVDRTTRMVSTLANNKGIPLYTNLPPGEVRSEVDIAKLKQVIINLVGNAIKFTEHGSVAVELRTSTAQIALLVRDTGPGIPPEVQHRIFEPFYQVGGSAYNRSKEGVGLGLTITAELVKIMGGEIRVQSHEGEGTLFEVTLPRYMESTHPKPQLAA